MVQRLDAVFASTDRLLILVLVAVVLACSLLGYGIVLLKRLIAEQDPISVWDEQQKAFERLFDGEDPVRIGGSIH